MAKATKNAGVKRRLKKKATKKANRVKEVKRLRRLGWPYQARSHRARPQVDELTTGNETPKGRDTNVGHNELEQRLATATSMKVLYKIATEYGIPRARDYKAVDREDLEAAILDAAKVR